MNTSSITIALVGSTGAVGQQVLQVLNKESQVDKIITITRKPSLNQLSKEENHVIDFSQLANLKRKLKPMFLFAAWVRQLKLRVHRQVLKK